MKQFLVEDSEKNLILFLHKNLLKEQVAKPMTDDEKLRKAISLGCLTNGSLKRQKSTGKIYYKKESTKSPGKFIKFFADMTFLFDDGSKKGKWKCDGIDTPAPAPVTPTPGNDPDYEIQKAKEQGWKTYDELKKEGVDPETLTSQFDSKVIGKTTLYKSKFSDNQVNTDISTTELNQQQKDFVAKWEGQGYKYNVPLVDRGRLKPVTPESLGAPQGLFKSGTMFYYDPTTVSQIERKGQSKYEDALKSQTPDKGACKDYVKDYFKSWQTGVVLDQSEMSDFKAIVQKCARTYRGRWGMVGAGKFDDMIDVLSGRKSGEGPSRNDPYRI